MRNTTSKPIRAESEILRDLEDLCSSPGYLHVIAYICFRDNFVPYAGDATAEQFAKLYSHSRLIKTEISTLIGFAIKHSIDWELSDPEIFEKYLERTDQLLLELHDALNAPMFEILKRAAQGYRDEDPFSSGLALREAVFYGADSAYTFQYRDLSPVKYRSDNDWLSETKGFLAEEATIALHAIGHITTNKLMKVIRSCAETHPREWTVLPAFEFNAEEIENSTGLPKEKVDKILAAFSSPSQPCNEGFIELNDFNIYNAYPLITKGDGNYISLQQHSLLEALYEAPFFWMISDKRYINTATANRGAFLEHTSHKFLSRVFGDAVLSNILIVDEHGTRAAEIDTLVIFGSRAIIVQAKSKRMTLDARKGNDKTIRSDFAKSVQASYEQGLRCAELIGDKNYKMVSQETGKTVPLNHSIDKIYIFCLISDHYPALSSQTRQFLKPTITDRTPAPFVMDVFLLDVMTEMLRSPLHFISYVDRRVGYNDRLMASHELTILSYHLKLNLWVESGYDLLQLGEDISTDLDLAMLVRRDGVEGNDTPAGILTRFKGTAFERLIQQIDRDPRDNAVDLGMFLLSLSEDTATQVSDAIDQLTARALTDGKPHDFTIGSGAEGLTIHISDLPIATAEPILRRHAERKKYQQHASRWIGVLISPIDNSIRLIGKLDFKWQREGKLDAEIAALPGTRRFTRPRAENGRKVGRNDRCPCGSGKKFKKCCS